MTRAALALLLLCALLVASCHGDPRRGPRDFVMRDGIATARSPRGFGIAIDARRVVLSADDGSWQLAIGTRSISRAVLQDASLTTRGDRVTLKRGTVEEWYVNLPRGLEQGYTFHQRPPGAGELRIDVAVDGLTPRQLSPDRIALRDAGGVVRLVCDALVAYDASGRKLPAQLEAGRDAIALRVDDRDARYPVVIDPDWAPQKQLSSLPPHADDQLGIAVALDGDTIVAGAKEGNGVAYVYRRSVGAWGMPLPLTALTPANGDNFGDSVDIDGDTIVVGAPGYPAGGGSSGGAFVFVYDGMSMSWGPPEVLTAAAGPNDRLGASVAISADTLVLGAPLDDTQGQDAGALYVMERDGTAWPQIAKLTVPGAASNAKLGGGDPCCRTALAIVGDIIVAGAAGQGVYVFKRSGGVWPTTPTQTFTLSSAALFGAALAFDGSTLVVGAPGGAGSAHAYTWDGTEFNSPAELGWLNPDANGFGNTIAVSGDAAIVGAPYFNEGVGAAVLFERKATWTQTMELPFAASGKQFFGGAVALDAGTAAVGAPLHSTPAFEQGAVFTYAAVGDPCAVAGDCTSGNCADATCCNVPCDGGCGRCDGPEAGTCTPLPRGDPGACSPQLCDGTALSCTPCVARRDCVPGHFCSDGSCVAALDIGASCAADEQCQSGYCVDGVCCESACEAQCDACHLIAGTCAAVSGAPQGNRPPCPADHCTDGVSYTNYTCSGDPQCTPTPAACEGYACDAPLCRHECLSDAHCSEGYECHLETASCRRIDPLCNGEHTLLLPDDSTFSCAPYRCNDAGACYASCSSGVHCANGFVCLSTGVCAEPPEPHTPSSDCGCRVAGAPTLGPPWWMALALALARRRRTGAHWHCIG